MRKATNIALAAALLMFSSLSADAAQNKTVEKKDWTFAVFLNGDNNLDPFGVEDQKEMSRVGSNDWMNIVTLFDRERGPASINYIEKNKITKIKDMGELDMGDYKEFVKFAKFIKENYPAKHYSFTLWNHGAGWKADNQNVVYRGISYDDSSNNHIATNQMGKMLAEAEKALGQKIDILNCDACLMQMVEVCYACKDGAKYHIASEDVEPGKGAPYDDILKVFKKGLTPEQVAEAWVKAFAKSYKKGGSQHGGYGEDWDSTQSAIDLTKMDNLADALNGLAKVVMSKKYSNMFSKVLRQVQNYEYPENIDLVHLCKLLKPHSNHDTSLKTALDKVLAAADEAIYCRSYSGNQKNSNGIAIYLPSNFRLESKYKTLEFAEKTMWDDMITALANGRKVAEMVDSVKKGDMKDLSKLVKTAKKNPRDPICRTALRELNFVSATEKAVPAKSQAEFDRLMGELKSALKRRK